MKNWYLTAQKENQDLLEKIKSHPFIKEVENGTLPEEKFLLYKKLGYQFMNLWAKATNTLSTITDSPNSKEYFKRHSELSAPVQKIIEAFYLKKSIDINKILSIISDDEIYLDQLIKEKNYGLIGVATIVSLTTNLELYKTTRTSKHIVYNPFEVYLDIYTSEDINGHCSDAIKAVTSILEESKHLKVEDVLEFFTKRLSFWLEFLDAAYQLKE